MEQKSYRKISIAISPDTDDQFMVWALKTGRISHPDYEFDFFVADIQNLNEIALTELFDITAISMAAFPKLRHHYQLMTIGSSIGDKLGPAIVVSERSDLVLADLVDKKIAVPGLGTSALLAAQSLIGPFQPVPTYFMDIAHSVKSGSVDAGILIHELQMDPSVLGLKKIGDLGSMWFDKNRLPLPLGGNAIRSSLPLNVKRDICQIYLDSIQLGLNHLDEAIEYSIKLAPATEILDSALGKKYIQRFVNEHSLGFQVDVLKSIKLMMQEGIRLGFFEPFDIESYIFHSDVFDSTKILKQRVDCDTHAEALL